MNRKTIITAILTAFCAVFTLSGIPGNTSGRAILETWKTLQNKGYGDILLSFVKEF